MKGDMSYLDAEYRTFLISMQTVATMSTNS